MVDSDSYITRRRWLVSAVCTIFITYPNVMWIPWNLARLADGEHEGFWAFFTFRIIYFYALFFCQLRFNFRRSGILSLMRRLGLNFCYTLAWCAIFVGLSYSLPSLGIQTGYVGNILLFQFFVASLLCTSIGHIISLDRQRRRKEQMIEQLKIENLQSRCNALTNQINPHFFFNSLNGIVSLVRRGDKETALEYVNQLSDIFRYILQSESRQLVPLRDEIRFVRAFGHVMQVRFGGKLSFCIDIDDSWLSSQVPVLSLLPLLENVTTHNRIDSDHIMEVRIHTSGNELIVSNPIYPKISRPYTAGTGLENLRNRFRLLVHKEISVCPGEGYFKVRLPI